MPFVLAFSSALLCWASFPPAGAWPLAWAALVPLFFLLDKASTRREAFGWAYLSGFLVFASTLWWIGYVTVIGTTAMIVYLALYYGVFGMVFFMSRGRPFGTRLFILPSVWVLLETVREHAFTGFGWSALAHTQAPNTLSIQIADITGAGGVSWLIVAVNLTLAEAVQNIRSKEKPSASFLFGACVLGVILLAAGGYGIFRLNMPAASSTAKVGFIQGNVTLAESWSEPLKPFAVERQIALTRTLISSKPDLLLWPETSFPQFTWEYPALMDKVSALVKESGAPLVLGAVTSRGGKYFNSALLLTPPNGLEAARYDKSHLVVFGEFIPFRREFPFLAQLAPIDDFTAGQGPVLFPLRDKTLFSVLICFEDTVPDLARQAVRQGSRLLVNITNDAWFQGSPGPLMHLHNALFRAVENRRALVRATNTGVSCAVDPKGIISACIEDKQGTRLLVAGAQSAEVPLGSEITFYTKFPLAFTFVCFLAILILFIILAGRDRAGRAC